MLILTRKSGESVNIGNNIRVTVLGIQGRQVRLGIEAPPETMVLREEVTRRIVQENYAAASTGDVDLHKAARLWKRSDCSRKE